MDVQSCKNTFDDIIRGQKHFFANQKISITFASSLRVNHDHCEDVGFNARHRAEGHSGATTVAPFLFIPGCKVRNTDPFTLPINRLVI